MNPGHVINEHMQIYVTSLFFRIAFAANPSLGFRKISVSLHFDFQFNKTAAALVYAGDWYALCRYTAKGYDATPTIRNSNDTIYTTPLCTYPQI